jgi:hypothetical protein
MSTKRHPPFPYAERKRYALNIWAHTFFDAVFVFLETHLADEGEWGAGCCWQLPISVDNQRQDGEMGVSH